MVRRFFKDLNKFLKSSHFYIPTFVSGTSLFLVADKASSSQLKDHPESATREKNFGVLRWGIIENF